jgi:hypothetical protein
VMKGDVQFRGRGDSDSIFGGSLQTDDEVREYGLALLGDARTPESGGPKSPTSTDTSLEGTQGPGACSRVPASSLQLSPRGICPNGVVYWRRRGQS